MEAGRHGFRLVILPLPEDENIEVVKGELGRWIASRRSVEASACPKSPFDDRLMCMPREGLTRQQANVCA